MPISAYPLAWPDHFPRTKQREAGRFSTSLAGALGNVQTSLNLFARDSGQKLDEVVISTNVSLGDRSPKDPGVAIWFVWEGMQVCIPVDRYHSVESNLQAIHYILEARRVELRHGTLELVKATFRGFLLPGPVGFRWRETLGVHQKATREEIREAYRKLATINHPDRGGDPEKMAEINAAWREAQCET